MTKKIKHWLRRCAACNDKLGQESVVVVDDNVYHACHFKCFACQQEITANDRFHSLDKERIVCISCFASTFAPFCSACNTGIIDNCVRANGQTFHQKCFVCKSCGAALSNEFFIDRNGNYVDRDCYWQSRLLKFMETSEQNLTK